MSHSTAATLRIPINMLCAIGAVIIWSTLARSSRYHWAVGEGYS